MNNPALGRELGRPPLDRPDDLVGFIAAQAGVDEDTVRRAKVAQLERRTGDPELDRVRARVLAALRRPSRTTTTTPRSAPSTPTTPTTTTTTTSAPAHEVERATLYGGR